MSAWAPNIHDCNGGTMEFLAFFYFILEVVGRSFVPFVYFLLFELSMLLLTTSLRF